MRYMPQNPRSRFILYSVVSLVVMAGVSFLLSFVVTDYAEKLITEHVATEAADDLAPKVGRELFAQDLSGPMSGERLREFDLFVRENVVSSFTARIKVWNKDATLVYSDNFQQIGEAHPENVGLHKALKGGVGSGISAPNPENRAESLMGTLMEIYVPLRLARSSEIQGALEVYQFYEPYQAYVARLRQVVFGMSVLALVTLYSAMTSAAYYTWKQVQRKEMLLGQRDLEASAAAELNVRVLNERAQLVQGVERQKERLAYLSLAMTLAEGSPGVMEMGRQLLGLIQQEVGAQFASLTLVAPDGTLGQRLDRFDGMEPFSVSSHSGGLAEAVLQTGKTQYIPDTAIDERANPELIAAGIRSYIAIAMKSDGRAIGILFFHSTHPHAFEEDKLFLESFARICAVPLQRAMLLSQIERAKEELETTFDALPEGVVMIDDNRGVLRANKSFARMVGKPMGSVVGANICRLMHGRDDLLHRCPLEDSIAEANGVAKVFREPYLGNISLRVQTYVVPSSGDGPRRYVQFFSLAMQPAKA